MLNLIIWILVVLVFYLDLPFVWWMFKSRITMRRFGLIPIFIIFILPFIEQPKIVDSEFLDLSGVIFMIFGFSIMLLGGFEFYKRGIIPALSKKETDKIKSDQATHILVATGIYKFIRHPQYVGLSVFFIGYSMLFNAFFSVLFSPVILTWFGFVAYIEERYDLEWIFGEEYKKYKKRVGMFFPKIR